VLSLGDIAPPNGDSPTVTGTAPAPGATSQFTATAIMSDGTTQDVTSQATWTSSNAADATVSSTGLVTGVTAGSVAIQATYLSITGTDQIAIGS
jgi:Bacterial Ig-like domain (group 2)